jgi:hypothetical protein
MEDLLRTRAQLVALDRADAIGTVVTRAEIAEAAAGSEFPATLLLDVDQVEAANGGEVTAHARIAVDWDQETLEQLLSATEDNQIELLFDQRELALAFDDVEGHGLRQKAAVLAVAIAAAGASAAPSLAVTTAGGGGGGGGAQSSSISVNPQAAGHGPGGQSAGAERTLQQDENIAVQQTQGTDAGTPAVTSSSDSTLTTDELAGIAGAAGALLISAAGFGIARKRTSPVQPA